MSVFNRRTGHADQIGVQRFVDQVTAPTETGDPMLYRVASDVFFNDAAGIPHPLVESAGGVKSLVAADSPYTVLESDRLILANTTAGAITLTLPAAGGLYLGRRLRIVDKARQFAVNNLTINGNGNNINGAATLVLSTQDGGVELVWGGTTWERDAVAPTAVSYTKATVSQATNINTDVTCNGNVGVITTQAATTAAATMETGFTLNNSFITVASVITFQIVGYSGTHITNGIPYLAVAAPGAGTVGIKVGNIHAANALNGTIKIHFSIS